MQGCRCIARALQGCRCSARAYDWNGPHGADVAQCSAREESSSRLCVAGSGTNRESTVSENRQGLPASTPSLLGGRAPPDPPPPPSFWGGRHARRGRYALPKPAAQCLLGVRRHSRSMSAWCQTSQPLNVCLASNVTAAQCPGRWGLPCVSKVIDTTVTQRKGCVWWRWWWWSQVCGPVYALKLYGLRAQTFITKT